LYEQLNVTITYTFLILSGIAILLYGFHVMVKDKETLKFNKDLAKACTIKLPKFKRKSKVDMDYVDNELQKILDNE
jgi:hypothetical protein